MAFEKHCSEAASDHMALEAACKRDNKSAATISELTALVREQKGRLAEFMRAKTEQMFEYRERILQLELQLDEARKRLIQMEMLKQEKDELQEKFHLQESLISELREERKVCNEEFTKQRSAIALDRDRLEATVKSLQAEINSSKKQIDHDSDALRIKIKVIEDQTETIKRLKEAVVERDEQIKDTRSELLQIQTQLEEQIRAEMAQNQSLTEQIKRRQVRTEDMKTQIKDLQSQLSDEKRARILLQDRWRQKTDTINSIEQQVCCMA